MVFSKMLLKLVQPFHIHLFHTKLIAAVFLQNGLTLPILFLHAHTL